MLSALNTRKNNFEKGAMEKYLEKGVCHGDFSDTLGIYSLLYINLPQ